LSFLGVWQAEQNKREFSTSLGLASSEHRLTALLVSDSEAIGSV
jgi:hypothetical protein